MLTGKWGASVTIVRISNAHWPEGQGECAPGKESPHPGLKLLPTNTHSTSSSTKTHLRSMSPPPRDARDPRLPQLSRQPQDHMAVETARPRERAGLDERARVRRRRGWGGRGMKRKCGGGGQERAEALWGVFATLTRAWRGRGFGAGKEGWGSSGQTEVP